MASTTDATPTGPGSLLPASAWRGQARAFAERYLRVLARNRMVLFWAVGFPAGFYLLTITLFVDTSEIPAAALPATKATVAVGFGVFGALVVCLNAFSQHLVEDVEDGRYEQFRALPVSPTADLAGRMLASFAFAGAALLAVLAVGQATGAAYQLRSVASVPILLGSFAGFTVLCMTVALLVAVAVTDARYAGVIALSLVMIAYFVTGFNGTQPAMFAGDPALLNVLPNALATRVMVYHLVDVGSWSAGGLAPPGAPTGLGPIALLGVYGAVCALVATVVARRIVYRRGVSAA